MCTTRDQQIPKSDNLIKESFSALWMDSSNRSAALLSEITSVWKWRIPRGDETAAYGTFQLIIYSFWRRAFHLSETSQSILIQFYEMKRVTTSPFSLPTMWANPNWSTCMTAGCCDGKMASVHNSPYLPCRRQPVYAGRPMPSCIRDKPVTIDIPPRPRALPWKRRGICQIFCLKISNCDDKLLIKKWSLISSVFSFFGPWLWFWLKLNDLTRQGYL